MIVANGTSKALLSMLIFGLGIMFSFVVFHTRLPGHAVMVERVKQIEVRNNDDHQRILATQKAMLDELQEIRATVIRIERNGGG